MSLFLKPKNLILTEKTKSAASVKKYLKNANLADSIIGLFDRMPDVYFFIKNESLELVAANDRFMDRMGVENLNDIKGRRSKDIDPPELALSYEEDDRRVINTGTPLLDNLELNCSADGTVDWLLTSKYPLKSYEGKTIGIIGYSSLIEKAHEDFGFLNQFSDVAIWIHEHLEQNILVEELAKMMKMSRRTFEKKFFSAFKLSPAQYIIRTRLAYACRILSHTELSLSEVGLKCGFYDQSAFSHSFRRCFGSTPLAYRKANNLKFN